MWRKFIILVYFFILLISVVVYGQDKLDDFLLVEQIKKPLIVNSSGKNLAKHRDVYAKFGLLGAGGFGEVWRAIVLNKNLYDVHDVVLKRLRTQGSTSSIARESGLREIFFGKLLKDFPNVSQFITSFEQGDDELWLVFAHEGASLAHYLRDIAPDGMQQPSALWYSLRLSSKGMSLLTNQIFGTLLQTITDLHSRGIVHRDIKYHNILLKGKDIYNSTLKLIDFGSTVMYTNPNAYLDKTGDSLLPHPDLVKLYHSGKFHPSVLEETVNLHPPEVDVVDFSEALLSTSEIGPDPYITGWRNPEFDLWQAGLVLLELLTGRSGYSFMSSTTPPLLGIVTTNEDVRSILSMFSSGATSDTHEESTAEKSEIIRNLAESRSINRANMVDRKLNRMAAQMQRRFGWTDQQKHVAIGLGKLSLGPLGKLKYPQSQRANRIFDQQVFDILMRSSDKLATAKLLLKSEKHKMSLLPAPMSIVPRKTDHQMQVSNINRSDEPVDSVCSVNDTNNAALALPDSLSATEMDFMSSYDLGLVEKGHNWVAAITPRFDERLVCLIDDSTKVCERIIDNSGMALLAHGTEMMRSPYDDETVPVVMNEGLDDVASSIQVESLRCIPLEIREALLDYDMSGEGVADELTDLLCRLLSWNLEERRV